MISEKRLETPEFGVMMLPMTWCSWKLGWYASPHRVEGRK